MGILLRVAACKCGMGSGVWVVGPDYRVVDVAVNDPGREAASLETFILNYPAITSWRRCSCGSRCRRRRGFLSAWEYPNIIYIFFMLVRLRIEIERSCIRHIAARSI